MQKTRRTLMYVFYKEKLTNIYTIDIYMKLGETRRNSTFLASGTAKTIYVEYIY